MRPTHLRRPLALLLVSLTGSAVAVGCSGEGSNPISQPGQIAIAEVLPPPISGGTLAIAKDGKTAVAADSDRDQISIVDLSSLQLRSTIKLEAGDEPGRVAIDDANRAHVILRGGGAFVTVDTASGKLLERRDVCAQPRGIAYDANGDRVHVACSTGELVSFPAAGGQATRTLKLDRDLRDIVVEGDKLLVSRFRNTEVLVVGVDGKVWQRATPLTTKVFSPFTGMDRTFEPAVAWRMVNRPGGGALMVHQRGLKDPVVVSEPGGYGGTGCGEEGGIVQTTVTEIAPGGEQIPVTIPPIAGGSIPGSAMPVDIAVSDASGSGTIQFAIVASGTNKIIRSSTSNVVEPEPPPDCLPPPGEPVPGQPVAAAFFNNGMLAVQLREPAMLVVASPSGDLMSAPQIVLSNESRRDTGHDLFHSSPTGQGSLACASCHPEGDDDHRTWNFDPIGARRTQSIRGGILATAPLHWDGDLADIGHLMSEVFVSRMGGSEPGPRHSRLLGRWVDGLPLKAQPAAADPDAVARGKQLYFDAKVGCATCHSGEKLTNNAYADVGTGKQFQVPTLMGIAERAPYMHDGCAKTLRARFDLACGGGDQHGVTSHLSSAQIDDLVAYIETL